jgi:hypothetical protein
LHNSDDTPKVGDGASDVPLNKLVALMVEEEGEEAQMPEEDDTPAGNAKEAKAAEGEEEEEAKASKPAKKDKPAAAGKHAQGSVA